MRLDDTYRMAWLRVAAAHQHAALAGFCAVGGKGVGVEFQRADALATAAAADEQGGLGQAITGKEAAGRETAGGELLGEGVQAVLADRLGAGIGHTPAAQVEAGQGRLTDPLAAQAVGKVRPAADGPAVFADRLQPALRPCEEVTWRHQYTRYATEDGLQQPADQAHVVVQRQPADDHIVGVEVDAKPMADQLLVGHQVAVADLHTLGQRGGAGGVLEEGDVVAGQRRFAPVIGQGRVQAIHRPQLRGAVCGECLQALQAVVQRCDGQQQAGLGVIDDRQQALLVMLARRLRRVGRHSDDTGIQAAEERRHIVRPAGEQQHGAVTERGAGLQGCCDGARTHVQVPIAEHRLLAGGIGQKAQGDAVRGVRSTLRQGLDQREREFEGVHHGVFLPVSG